LWFQGMGVLGLGFYLLTLAPMHIPSTEVALYTLIETVLGPVWVYLGGYEAPSIYAISGGILLVAALATFRWVCIRMSPVTFWLLNIFSYFVFGISYTCSYITLRDEQRAAAGSKFVALDDEATTPSNGGNSNNFSAGSKGPHGTGKATAASDSKKGTALNAAFNMAMIPAVAYPWRAVPVPLTADGDLHQHQQVEVVNILHNQEQKNGVSKAREGDSNDESNPSGASTGESVFNVIHGQTLVGDVV
jgi:hypothetical protein